MRTNGSSVGGVVGGSAGGVVGGSAGGVVGGSVGGSVGGAAGGSVVESVCVFSLIFAKHIFITLSNKNMLKSIRVV
jgi:hypothetical protein